MFAAYNRLLTRHPMITKMLTTATLFSLGDIITQKVIDKKESIDWKRNSNLFLVGACYFAPMLHNWYCRALPYFGSKVFNETTPKAARVLISMAADQLAFAPIILAGFFIINALIDDPSSQGFKKGVVSYKQKIWETLKINWMIWPIATTVNLWLVPLQYQVLFANVVGLFWNVILSYIAYDEKTVSPAEKVV